MLPRPPLTVLMLITAQANAAPCAIHEHVKKIGTEPGGVGVWTGDLGIYACSPCPAGTHNPIAGGDPAVDPIHLQSTYCEVKYCPANSVATASGACDQCSLGYSSVDALKNGFPAYCTGAGTFITALDDPTMVAALGPGTHPGCSFTEEGTELALEVHDTVCQTTTCTANQYVKDGVCEACPAGFQSKTPDGGGAAGDTAACGIGGGTAQDCAGSVSTLAIVLDSVVANMCSPVLCETNHYVDGTTHECTPCPAGKHTPDEDCTQDEDTGVCDPDDSDPCGDDGFHTSGGSKCGNTDPNANSPGTCHALICEATTAAPSRRGKALQVQHVVNNVCTDCPDGSKDLAAGHHADGADTECLSDLCPVNTYADGAGGCEPCEAGQFRAAGDKKNSEVELGPCLAIQCPSNHWVSESAEDATSADDDGAFREPLRECQLCPTGTTTKVSVMTDTDAPVFVDVSAMMDAAVPSCLPDGGGDPANCAQLCVPEVCPADFTSVNGACVQCPVGTQHGGGATTAETGTPCVSIPCGDGFHVVAHECVECAPGSTNREGDLADGDDTECDATMCPEHFFVEGHTCHPCPPGTTNVAEARRDASRSDTQCEATLCGPSERVLGHSCVSCAPGSTKAAGDDASGSDTQCVHICLTKDDCDPGEHCTEANACASNICKENEYAAGHMCMGCPAGTWRAAGDDASGSDTEDPPCEPTLCGPNMYVESHKCVVCPPGTTNQVGGGDASGPDTFESCVHTICSVDQHVVSNECVACAPGSNHPEGDDATSPDTNCAHQLCADGEHVMSHACVACAAGMLRKQGQSPDDATGDDTACEPKLCEADQHVSSNDCVPCGAGTTTDAGHDASGSDTSCTAICTSDAHCDAEENCNTAKNRCESITPAPPTSAPTTSAPTTSAPTTSAPTTSAPTTSAPTTSAPTPGPKTCGGEPDPVRCRDLACPTFKESCRAKCDNCPATVPPTKATPATVWTLEADQAKCKGGGKPIFVVDRAACEKHAEKIGATHYSFRSDKLQCATVPGHGKATDCQHKETPGRKWQIYSSGQSTTPPVPSVPSCFSKGKIKKSKQCNGGMGKPLRNLASPEACQAKCKESEPCMSFTFTLSGKCALKSCEFGNGNLVPVKNGKRISGPKQC